MGQTQSTPLSLLLANFRDVKARGHNLSLDIRKRKLITYCHSEWPTFGVNWPTEGTFCLPVVLKIKSKIFLPGKEGHSDQIPYILVWQDLVENPPPWMASFLTTGPCRILAAKPINPPKPPTPTAPPVLPDSQDLLSLGPPPYQVPPLIPQAAPIPAAPAEPPVAQPIERLEDREAQPAPMPRGDEVQSPAGHTRRRAPHEPGLRLPDSTVALPLRETGPPDDTGNPRLQYWPFSTSDLYNWKTQNAQFSDNPKDLISLLDSVMFTHQPTWDDCQQLLRILFTEERERIQLEARKLVPGDDCQPTANLDLINAAFPLTRPPQDGWDYNTAEGRGRLRIYRQTLMAGLRAAARKPTNLAKVYSVIQGKTESPATYLERLMKTFRQYTPMDPEAP
ncbi:uncharacterized protein LOC123384816 [Felis catus]|uniref:Core shell protein Gag P30 domain-containing protein n=1 Tax=Felis catus TaxID=9685 RepID=A0ABI7YXA0_FELCA|nr:uncharacterized protein LOC123384816 [Felis catus]